MTVTYADKPWLKQYDEGVPEKVEIPNHSLHHFLEEAAKEFGVKKFAWPRELPLLLQTYSFPGTSYKCIVSVNSLLASSR